MPGFIKSITPKGISVQHACLLTFLLLLSVTVTLYAGPSGDYGDAWVGEDYQGIEAYTGVLSRFVSYYTHTNTVFMPQYSQGTWLNSGATFHLGTIPPDLKTDTEQDPYSPENDAYPLILVEGTYPTPGPNPLATMAIDLTTTADHDPTTTIYLNVFIDQNRDGQWKDGYNGTTTLAAWNMEWVVQDFAITQDAGRTVLHTISYLRLASPTEPVWIRLIASDQPLGAMYRPYPVNGSIGFWDATLPSTISASGEVEDFLLGYYYNPDDMPNTGLRGWGILMRRRIQPNNWNKAECILTFTKVNYNRPLGEMRYRLVKTPWCDDGRLPFGYVYSSININNGCDDPAQAAIGLYGHKLIQGRGQPPDIGRTALGNATIQNLPLNCPGGPAINLPNNHPDNPADFPADDLGVVPASGLINGAQYWDVCYPDPPRHRVYASKLLAKTCGSETQIHGLFPAPEDLTDMSTYTGELADSAGKVIRKYWEAGDLLEQFVDLNEPPVEFPDPDFTDYSFIITEPGYATLSEDYYLSPPSALYLQTSAYEVRPDIPETSVATAVQFNYSGPGFGMASVVSTEGETVAEELVSASGWAKATLDLPEDFELDYINIYHSGGYIDSLIVRLGSSEGPPSPLDDCNGNDIVDELDIQEGYSEDGNGNFIPDECEDYIHPFKCGNANSDEQVDISDAVFLINYVFVPESPAPVPLDIANVNCDLVVDISDAVYLINFVFVPESPAPCECK